MPFWASGITAKQEAEAEKARHISFKWKSFQKGESSVLLPEQALSFWGTVWLKQTSTKVTVSLQQKSIWEGKTRIH